MLLKNSDTPVVALFASATKMHRISLQLYAEHHHEVKFAALVATGHEILTLLGEGLRPAVLVLDVPFDDMELPDLLVRVARLVPEVAVLVATRVPCEDALERLLLTFPRHEIMLMSSGVSDLFARAYRLGAGGRAGDAYIVCNACSHLLDAMRAESHLMGRVYLQEMVAGNILAGSGCGIGELKRSVAQQHGTDVEAVTSALNRVNRRMHLRGSALYRRFALQNGKSADDRLPLGELVKSLSNEVCYVLNG